ncbi:hypothetical protein I5M27_14720 [Adhaeribacter sp. BT258]|uniref:Lipoprotein n=1 Tax=Adhaeribacter terrigena TaxID=2793070 RepID=A0ABS1C4C2_9BACT|nr:hypothetical protein [Adhaeribacter terrigena]MBK0404247.1 hypothetical protein [Adhaeribacter terrigena]
MRSVLFCSFLLAFFGFSCKPKPLDNLKEVALAVEQRKVKRMSREQIAAETQRVADSVLTLVFKNQQELAAKDSACNFVFTKPYRQFQQKYHGRAVMVADAEDLKKLENEMAELRKYRNELSENEGKLPATFQTLTDSLLYVRPVKNKELVCAPEKAGQQGFWVFRMPKQRLIEIKTVKVKPKPAKGPNW